MKVMFEFVDERGRFYDMQSDDYEDIRSFCELFGGRVVFNTKTGSLFRASIVI